MSKNSVGARPCFAARWLDLGIAVLGLALSDVPVATATQVGAPQAAPTITAADVARHLTVLAADSLRRRDTPSPGLERTARYIAAVFQRLGLQPGIQNEKDPTWVQRYPVPGQQRVSAKNSRLFVVVHLIVRGKSVLNESGMPMSKGVNLEFATSAYFAPEVGHQVVSSEPYNIFSGLEPPVVPMVIMAGHHTVASVRQVAGTLRESVVLYVPPADVDSAVRSRILAELYATSYGVMMVGGDDSTGFAVERAAREERAEYVDRYMRTATSQNRWPWAVVVWGQAIRSLLGGTGEDLDRLRAETVPAVRTPPSTVVWPFFNDEEQATVGLVTAPNVVGVLVGSDSVLRRQYVVITAHMDNGDTDAGQTDSLAHGTPDNAVGIAGLLAIAEAASKPGVRLRRSLVFLATSGGVKGFWGANFFTYHPTLRDPASLAVDLNLDRLDRPAAGPLIIDGLHDVELATAPELVAASHPELGVTFVDGGTVARPRSDHFSFVRTAVPSLYFHTADSLGPETSPSADTSHIASVLQFIFYMGQTVTDADRPPQWTPEGRKQLRTVFAP